MSSKHRAPTSAVFGSDPAPRSDPAPVTGCRTVLSITAPQGRTKRCTTQRFKSSCSKKTSPCGRRIKLGEILEKHSAAKKERKKEMDIYISKTLCSAAHAATSCWLSHHACRLPTQIPSRHSRLQNIRILHSSQLH